MLKTIQGLLFIFILSFTRGASPPGLPDSCNVPLGIALFMYADDCFRYFCFNGTEWSRAGGPATNYCCKNPDWDGEDSGYIESPVTIPFKRSVSSMPTDKEWYGLNEKRIRPDGMEVVCSRKQNWNLVGSVCEFNGKYYRQAERLPGCIKVYCIRGKWHQTGYIDQSCRKCYARWDPHLRTFDGWHYDYHGTKNYAMTQKGTSLNPQFGIFTKFYKCGYQASCVGSSTYMDSPKTIIEMGIAGKLFKLHINGTSHDIDSRFPELVKERNITHPVLSWKYNGRCIRLFGSSGLAVEKCKNSLTIWVNSDFHNHLYGLCGFFDGDEKNDFKKRDESYSSLHRYPLGSDFPSSWEVGSKGGEHENSDDENVRGGNCTIDEATDLNIHNQCTEIISESSLGLSQEEKNILNEDCFFDLCTISRNTSDDNNTLSGWIDALKSSLEEISDVANKTTDEDALLDELLAGNETSSSAKNTTTNTKETTILTSEGTKTRITPDETPATTFANVTNDVNSTESTPTTDNEITATTAAIGTPAITTNKATTVNSQGTTSTNSTDATWVTEKISTEATTKRDTSTSSNDGIRKTIITEKTTALTTAHETTAATTIDGPTGTEEDSTAETKAMRNTATSTEGTTAIITSEETTSTRQTDETSQKITEETMAMTNQETTEEKGLPIYDTSGSRYAAKIIIEVHQNINLN